MRVPSLRLPTVRLPDPIVSELVHPRYIAAAFLFAFWVLLLGGAMLVLLPGLLFAQDSTVVVDDKTGLFGPVIDKFWPVIVTFLTSLAVKVIATVNETFRSTSEPVKWAALYGFSLLFNAFARWAGIGEVDPLTFGWGSVAALSAVQTAAAALVYKFGGHRAPEVQPIASSRRAG